MDAIRRVGQKVDTARSRRSSRVRHRATIGPALIGYIERDGQEGAERVDAQLDSAGNLIENANRDARDGPFVDVERVLADRKHFLSPVPDVEAAAGEVTMLECPIETQGVMSLDTAAVEFPRGRRALARD